MVEWKKVEAALFASGKYMSEEQLAEMSGLSKKKVKEALKEIKKHYDKSDTSLGLFNEGDEWKLNVKEDYNSIVRNVISEAEMPKHIMETLAVIAYKSPVLQSEIKKMRGLGSYDHIRALLDKGFITREKHGRTFKIKISEKFNEYFDLDDERIAEMFKGIKKPDPDKLGALDVYDSKKDNNNGDEIFDQQVIDRMKKIETTDEDHENNHKFLNEMDEKIDSAKTRIDEAEEEMSQYKRTEPEDGEENSDQAPENSLQDPELDIEPTNEDESTESKQESEDSTQSAEEPSTNSQSTDESSEDESESDKILREVSEEVKELTKKDE